MATIISFEDIRSRQKARILNNVIVSYIDAGRFKRNFGLIDQIERPAGSIMDNIAEGFERSGQGNNCLLQKMINYPQQSELKGQKSKSSTT